MKRALGLFLFLSMPVVQAEILKVEIEGPIDPITSEFITSAIEQAEDSNAEFLLIRLATPGGLGISMQEIIQSILNSPVPVVCFVAPQGARAASAGFFILLSADVAVMAPGTNTGAAHPVFPFGMENKIMLEKVKNDAVAGLRAIVQQRKRNYELAEKGVLESKSYTAQEALEGGLIDLVAGNESDLMATLEGRQIERFSGASQVLTTEGQEVRVVEMTFRQKVLSSIANPNVALILGVIGLLGLYLEFSNPGLILPGVLGGISLLLALLGFSLLPVNYIGILLILLALGLFVAEVTVQGFGVLGAGGTVAMILGILFLVDSPFPELRISYGLAVAVAIPFALIAILLLHLTVKSVRLRVTTGTRGMVGTYGVSQTPIEGDEGWVLVAGERWKAVSATSIPQGVRVKVVASRNLVLVVEPYAGSEVSLATATEEEG